MYVCTHLHVHAYISASACCMLYASVPLCIHNMPLNGVTISKWFVRAGFIETIAISLPDIYMIGPKQASELIDEPDCEH